MCGSISIVLILLFILEACPVPVLMDWRASTRLVDEFSLFQKEQSREWDWQNRKKQNKAKQTRELLLIRLAKAASGVLAPTVSDRRGAL